MGFFFTKKPHSEERIKPLHFSEWAIQNSAVIGDALINTGIAFINNEASQLKTTIHHLILDDRWHYLDKPTKKQSYRGKLSTDSHGAPTLNLTYYSFRQGGVSVKFNNKETLKLLWQQHQQGRAISAPIKPKTILPTTKPITQAIDWLARDLVLWQAMALLGESHYLNRKGLGTYPTAGIRYSKNHIAVQIIDTQGAYFGLQKIFNDGTKLFTKGGAKKGHFALLGAFQLPEKLTTIHICEGVATAATIALALQQPVFSALDAFNLLLVGRALKRLYPKTPIVFWADNDWQKADKLSPSGVPLGNTGLIQANNAAAKLRNSKVATPDFSGFEPSEVLKATDFNDLAQLAGLDIISQAIPQKADLALGLTHELRAYHKRAHGVLSPSQFEQGEKISYNSRYLPQDIFEKEGVHLVRSSIGTGKTEAVEKLVKHYPEKSVLFTTHLISLVESAATRLGLMSYNKCDNFDLLMEPRLAICLNSLGKLTAEGPLRDYDLVIIDEIEQVLARLTTHIEQKPLVFNVLRHVMSNAKTLICLDAHLSATTVQLIQELASDKPITVHFNEFAPETARTMVLHESSESVQMSAMQALNQNKTAYLAFNSKKEAFKTFSTLEAAFPEKKGLYISSDNTGDEANCAFFNDVNEESKLYDFLVCTPSVSTGVSIDNGHFDFVGGVFNAQVNTANDCMQALGRVRNQQTLHVCCERRQGNFPLNPEVIAAKWTKTHPYDVTLMNLNEEGGRVMMSPDYESLMLSVTQARHASFNDFYLQFALLALSDNITLTYVDDELEDGVKKQLRDFKSSFVQHEANTVSLEILKLNPKELQNLANKPRKTMSESRQYKKKQLIDFYNLHEKDTDTLTAIASLDNEGRFKKKLLNLELALGNEELAKKRFLNQLEDGAQFAADLTHFASLQMLYKKLLQTLQCINDDNKLTTQDYRYTQESIIDSGFLLWLDDNRAVLQGLFTIPTLPQLNREPIRFISKLLADLGLKQKRVGRAKNAVYHLESSRTQLLNNLIQRRRSGFQGMLMPINTEACPTKKVLPIEFIGECFQKIKRFFTLAIPEPSFA